MKVAVFNTKPHDRQFLEAANAAHGHDLVFFEPRLTTETVRLADGFAAVCVFVNDLLDAAVLSQLKQQGTGLIAMRCAGFNNLDLAAAGKLNLTVVRVPAYSPFAVAEHTVGLILTLNRRIHRAYNRVREGNFSLEGLLGFDLHGKTIGVVGTGRIGCVVTRIMRGFGCHVLAYDPLPNAQCQELGAKYLPLDHLLCESDIITLHCPLTPQTHHLVDSDALLRMKEGVMLINTSRGALIDTSALIQRNKDGKIGAIGLDVYEEEEGVFFEDLSDRVIQDDILSRLLTFPNVLITSHQAFFTREAVQNIAQTTLDNITAYEQDRIDPANHLTRQG